MGWKCIFCVILCRILLASGEYECTAEGSHISCSALEDDNLYDHLTVALTREESNELQELLIENSSVSVIKSDMFVNFPNIQILRLRNASIQTVEEGAFQDLLNLKKVYLTDNYLEVLNSNVFPSNNSIRVLDLSRNLLNNLDDFDLEPFPLLTIMNVSHNRLEYLPDNIMNKLDESNNFYLIVDNNPWNCLHPKWVLRLTEILVEAFCTNKSYDPTEMDIKVEKLTNPEYKNGTKNEATPEQNSFYCLKYSLKSCLMWAFGAVWVGVILGNMCKLKRMLFTQPRRYEDKNTQCEYAWREPFMREEFSKLDNQNKKMSNKPNTSK